MPPVMRKPRPYYVGPDFVIPTREVIGTTIMPPRFTRVDLGGMRI
jgi:hypothetical protein